MTTHSLTRDAADHGLRARLGAFGLIAAVLLFAITVVFALGTAGTAYVWSVNMISDLGDTSCRIRGGRWICSPGFAAFNNGLIATGLLLAASGWCLSRLWGRLLAASVVVMGGGLILAAVFPAGDYAGLHLAGVVLALVVPGLGFLVSAIRPATPWLRAHRVQRGVLGAVALVFCAENRLPVELIPQGAGQAIIVACVVLTLLVEAVRVVASRPIRR